MGERVAVITGGAQGIGEGVARRLLADGIRRLALIDRNREGLAVVAKALEAGGAEALMLPTELLDVGQCRAAIAAADARFGRIDILINAAGNTERGGVLDTDEALFERSIGVNLRAPFFLIQEAAAVMRRGKAGGVIVSVASMLAHGGPPNIAIYSVAKAGLVTLTKTAANTLKSDRIRCFAINLGWAVTPQEHALQTGFHGQPEDWAERIGARQPFGRLVRPEDVGGLCSFLVSRDAEMMTGAIIDLEQFVMGTYDVPAAALV